MKFSSVELGKVAFDDRYIHRRIRSDCILYEFISPVGRTRFDRLGARPNGAFDSFVSGFRKSGGGVPGGIAETTGESAGRCNSWRICNVSKSPGACGDASNKPIVVNSKLIPGDA